ncbi:MAG: phytanoyl-CoA dioxygenase family protein, partial [Actinomycetota bacterium]|nr:phytanoyl-CoA dioxygenase family protein [Actinomycetota bacterium]
MTDPVASRVAAAFDVDGFATVDRLVDDHVVEALHDRFDRLFRGRFETGVAPDEVNWQEGTGDPTLTRQLCNAWKADRLVASVVLDSALGEALAHLAGWPGARIIQDNVLWKPPGARSVGFHRDNAYLAWCRPREMATCWIALDPTTSDGGTIEFARGSHRWATGAEPPMDFHAPDDHRAPMEEA